VVVGVMVVFGKEYEMPMPFEEIEKLELLDLVSHGDMKSWFEDHEECYEISVTPQKDEDGWCTNNWDVVGQRENNSGELEFKTFKVKIRYNMHNHGKYARYMFEFWEEIMEGYADDSDEEESDEEEPDYLEEADKKPGLVPGSFCDIAAKIIKKKWAERKIQKFILERRSIRKQSR
tara:strand:- start:8 stop:535 length:528 start_codon:yes stop_codon:yes gene_type:complete